MNKNSLVLLSMMCAIFSGAAVAARWEPEARLEQVKAVAKEPIAGVNFRAPSKTHSWEFIDDRNLIIWHTLGRAYWVGLEKSDGCRDLKREHAMRLEPGAYDLDSRSGYIRLHYGGWCDVESVRPLDVKALRELEKAARAAKASKKA